MPKIAASVILVLHDSCSARRELQSTQFSTPRKRDAAGNLLLSGTVNQCGIWESL